MSEDNILKFPANQAVEVRLKKTEPFWTGVDKFQKNRYGYELHNDITGKEKMYISETCHELIQVSGVKELDLFQLMLKNENNKSIWLLSRDGKEWKNKYQFHDEKLHNKPQSEVTNDASNTVHNPVPSNTVPSGDNVGVQVQALSAITTEIEKLSVRVGVLEEKLGNQSKPEPVTERDIPF